MERGGGLASIAELTARIKAIEFSIARLAAEKYPQTIYLRQISGVGPITSLYFVLKIENPERFKRTETLELSWVCVPSEIKAQKPTRSCASANAETAICAAYWWAPRNIAWDHLGPKVR